MPGERDRFDGTVEFNRPLCREHFQLRIRVNEFPPTEPGQFIQLGCRGPDRAIDCDALFGRNLEWLDGQEPGLKQQELRGSLAMLRRPFSLAGRGDDDRGVWMDVIHRVVGVGTEWLSELAEGDAIDLIGPLGNAFPLIEGKSLGLLVGGGVGLPPMFYLAEALHEADWDAIGFVGAMTRDLLAVTFDGGGDVESQPIDSVHEFARYGFPTMVTTDDGSFGLPGRITSGLERVMEKLTDEDAARAVVYTCGPQPMMHAVAKLAEARDIECRVCLEQSMACGMGTCQSCIVQIEDPIRPHGTTDDGRPWRYKLACTDGPVFGSDQVIW
jgi:dihydroorotate dehydrogenase electron transfer subunit